MLFPPHTKVQTSYARDTRGSQLKMESNQPSRRRKPFLQLDEIARRNTDGRADADGQRYKKGPPRRLSLKKSSENDSEDKMVEGFTTNSQWKGFLPYFSLILGEA